MSDDDSTPDSKKRRTLRSIPTSRFSRGLRVARLTASVGASALGGKVATMFSNAAEKELKTLMGQVRQAQKIADTLSQMKGAAMKLGQILSLHGEHLFPKEVVEVLSRLQSQSDEMDFSEIRKVLTRELGGKLDGAADPRLDEISERPIASASIGQVHRARAVVGGKKHDVAVKVQYPGVDKSIDSDVDALASLFSVLTRFPSAESFNTVTDEIKSVLRHETDYLEEGKNLEFFREYFKRDESLVVPRYVAEVSTRHVLTSELVTGITVQEFAASTASQAARDHLGAKYLEVFYEELMNLGRVQTDPNFANYKIQWSFGVAEPKLVLLDFGATKVFSKEFRESYKSLVRACLVEDYDAVRRVAIDMEILREDDSKELVDMHYELARMFMEPFMPNKPYDWGASDLAERVRKQIPKFIFAFKLRPPPRDFIFLNRKVVGVYFFASAIGSRHNPRGLLDRFLG
ncbi:MAG: AarF/ABC1/UbiB kinase family protein [Deltaproteobacteria bacterium]|nr:AarF/ABC1/UbiB kinase family protein [Deltaproteobacteria bacterium]